MTEYCRASNDFSVYTDGQYFVKWRFNKSGEEKPDEALSAAGDGAEFCERSKTYRCSGKMSAQAFQRLMEAVNTDPWRRKGEQIFACDGDAWKFRQFDANGNTVRDSGALGYIYGNAVLERIASLLWELALHDAE